MKRVRLIHVCLITLLSLIFTIPALTASAQGNGIQFPSVMRHGGPPVIDWRAPIPPQVTRRVAPWEKGTGRAGFSSPVVQTVDLTQAPSPDTTNAALIQDQKPYWSRSDENVIVFQSDRVTNTDGTYSKAADGKFHIWRMNQSGGGLQALTGPDATANANGVKPGATAEQIEPALSPNGTTLVYIEKSSTGAVDIMELDLGSRTAKSLLQSSKFPEDGTNAIFAELNHPGYGPITGGVPDPKASGIGVIFAGRRTGENAFHLYAVDTGSGRMIRLCPTAVSSDRNPTVNPDTQVIAFDSDRTDGTGTATGGKRDVWVIGVNQLSPVATRLTNGPAGCENIEPAWSGTRQDLGGHINKRQLIAFASTRTETGGVASTHDIWWMHVTVAPDPTNPASYTVLDPEGATNNALKLNTSDPAHLYDDRWPTWPMFLSTYRVAYDSDRAFFHPTTGTDPNQPGDSGNAGAARDIFASTIIDINAPSLIRYDNDNVIKITPRLANPGGNVTIEVKVADLESGMPSYNNGLGDTTFRDGVWVQIKNPNSLYQSSDGKEHKVYRAATRYADGDQNHPIYPCPEEIESEPIFIGQDAQDPAKRDPRFNTYSLPPLGGLPASWPRTGAPIYWAGSADSAAFSGFNHPPFGGSQGDTGWMPLYRVPNSYDPNTGSWTYSGTWQADTVPSDYYVDVIVYDNAQNPLSGGAGDRAMNWKIYDNIWGFTTVSFLPKRGILFVSDYAAGQKWFSSRFGTAGLSNVFNTNFGTESYMTDIDLALMPRTIGTGTTPTPISNALEWNSLGAYSYPGGGSLGDADTETIYGAHVPMGMGYDMWRIQCRGPVTPDVLQKYSWYSVTQPRDPLVTGSTNLTIKVYPGCVIWHSPFTGDVFTGPGSLTDQAVQGMLHNFLASGGRLFVNGEDIAWGLSLQGTAANTFLSNDLRASYSTDDVNRVITPDPSNTNPLVFDPWPNWQHYYPGPNNATHDTVNNGNKYFGYWGRPMEPPWYSLSSPADIYPDGVKPAAGAVADMWDGSTDRSVLLHNDDTAGTGSRMVYGAGGMEALIPDLYIEGNPSIMYFKERRPELFHNIVCWLRTGSIHGQILDIEGGAPVPGVFVRLQQGSQVNYTAVTDKDGKFSVDGVIPAFYSVVATKTGYYVHRGSGTAVHGGAVSQVAGIRLTKAEPADITGKIATPDGKPVAGMTVTAVDNADTTGATKFTATTDVNGNYDIQRVASGTTYTLTVQLASGQGSTTPASYQVPDTTDAKRSNGDTYVAPSKTYAGYDFVLKAAAGTVSGSVVSSTDNSPIAGATVTVTPGGQTATTDASGNYTIGGVDPGAVGLVATAPGFTANTANPVTVTVVSNQTVTATTIKLDPAAPGTVSGLVVDMNQQPLAGVQMKLLLNGVVQATGTTTSTVQTDTLGNRYNYRISTKSGVAYTVTATLPGYTPNPATQTTPVVAAGGDVPKMNFEMDPLHTFSRVTSLVSSPYDYTGNNAADLLLPAGFTSANLRNFLFATWNPVGGSGGTYVFYPTNPADTFHPGRGYFVGYTDNMALRTTGGQVDQSTPFEIPLKAGWNLIGDPFSYDQLNAPISIDWTKVSVRKLSGAVEAHDQAVSDGTIASALYTYAAGTYVLDYKIQPWVGYWVRAYQDCSLILDPVGARISRAAALRTVTRAALAGNSGWGVNLQVKIGGYGDNASLFGTSSRAADGYDTNKVEKAPLFGDQYAYLTFDHPDWGDKAGAYGVDIRSASTAPKSWQFTVRTNIANQTATLSWPNASAVGRSVALTLTDLATGNVRDLRANSSYTWQTGAGETSRQFRIDAAPAGRNGLVISDLNVRSTGRAAAGASSAINVNFNLSQAANVEIRVLDGASRQVRQLSGRASRAAGINQVTWDQKNDRGAYIPAGTYMVEVRAQTTDGKQTVRAFVPVLVTR